MTRPQWVQDYEKYEKEMGPPISGSASMAEVAGGCFALVVGAAFFIGGCVLMYIIGRAIVGV